MTERGRRLAIDADLDLTIEEADVRVRGYGDLVVVDAPTLGVARSLLRGAFSLPIPSAAPRQVAESGPAVDVRVRGGSVARIGRGVEPGVVSRLLGVAPARVSACGVLLAMISRRRG
ncbi:hypothetical protein [Halegenticoccus tardaugens]|uniref:hypothetical protein n=1 Tax=Halegenticoccus tardaugens TaxID=2071624 RepID=UPI00100C06AF|nr:hypothetical protein [Halegenticoccus tardaugens]